MVWYSRSFYTHHRMRETQSQGLRRLLSTYLSVNDPLYLPTHHLPKYFLELTIFLPWSDINQLPTLLLTHLPLYLLVSLLIFLSPFCSPRYFVTQFTYTLPSWSNYHSFSLSYLLGVDEHIKRDLGLFDSENPETSRIEIRRSQSSRLLSGAAVCGSGGSSGVTWWTT